MKTNDNLNRNFPSFLRKQSMTPNEYEGDK